MGLSENQIERYSRQILLKEIGGGGQEKLLGSTAFILGAGGLGSPAALYLAAAGVGHLIIADSDRVELSNLQRQVLHTTDRIGIAKVASAAITLRALNADVRVTTLEERIDANNIQAILPSCQVALDGSDNYSSRYLLNAACLATHTPLISGAVLGFDGQVATFRHGVDAQSPCYQCLHPQPPATASVSSCATAGILGGLAGMVGTILAIEAIKELLGIGRSLAGSLLLINSLDSMFHRVYIPKNPKCPTCAAVRELSSR